MEIALKDYDFKILEYITDYTRQNKVPPTIDLILENVPERSSKSTIHNHLKKMVKVGLLSQKNVKGYYYPTSLEDIPLTEDSWFLRNHHPKEFSNIWITADTNLVYLITSFSNTWHYYEKLLQVKIVAWKYAQLPEPYTGESNEK